MIKTYITALLVVLLAGTQAVQAQEDMNDLLADLETAPETSASEAVVEPAADTVADISTLFDRGRAYYKAGDYDNAEAAFGTMLAIDPYNSNAMDYLKRTAKRIEAAEAHKQVSTRARAMAEIQEIWNEDPEVAIAVKDPEGSKELTPEEIAIQQMEARIKAIMIPTLEFRDATAMDVVLFLSETCRRLDDANNNKGVNIMLLGMGGFDAEANSITISTREMSLYTALGYVSEMANLKFEVKPNAIAIMPVDYAPAGALIRESYTVTREVGDLLSAGGGSDSGGGSDDLFGGGDSSFDDSSAGGPTDVAAFFSTIDFPEGSSAEYHPAAKTLFVENTEGNLGEVEAFLAKLEDQASIERSQQVEIEAKFVEFSEGALEELGFDWTVYGSGSVGGFEFKDGTYFNKTSGYTVPRTPRDPAGADDPYRPATLPTPIYTDPVSGYAEIPQTPKPGQNLFGSVARNNTSAFGTVLSGVTAAMGGNPAAMVFGNGDVDLRITAMEQEGTADVLSAPKVTTKSGNEAIIRVVEVHRYPQDWDVETGQKTAPVIKPQDWEDFDLGVVLKVTPMVNTDSNTIDLELNPEITKFKGFDEYKVGSNAYDVSGNNSETLAIVGDNAPLIVKMPYFEMRTIQTQVTIADGNTVLMGGLVSERTETFRDQVPFLGDIPYLGRLFRTEGSRTSKKNLVIYVKATQIDERGMSQANRDTAREVAAAS